MRPLLVQIKRLPNGEDLPLPGYATEGAAAMDLYAADEDTLGLPPGERIVVRTGIAVAIPEGYEMQIRPRSGLAAKRGLTVLNAPGTIDSDFRGEVCVILHNTGTSYVFIERGMRIAQAVVAPVLRVDWSLTDELPDTARGEGGFGSTGR